MKFIFVYGPDGCGKTTVALEMTKHLDRSVIIPFEPGKLGDLIEDVDSGFGGRGSAVNNAVPFYKSTYFVIRYVFRVLMFKIRFHKKFDYVIFTRGPLEFGINDTHRNYPKLIGSVIQKSLSARYFLITRPVEDILRDKPELPKYRILGLYEDYLKAGCLPIANNCLEICVNDIITRIK